jgi:threonylcarbamoyladenosine tRNA methylthiotransferase MtaB
MPRSVPARDIIQEVEGLVGAGVSEVVLTGINIGGYDSSGMRLEGLVREVAATGIPRLRLSSVEPLDLTSALLGVLGSVPNVCPHLHVPMQSGSDEILARMGRRYTAAEYAERIARAREAIPGLAVTSDVIVGFPGETESDFGRTVDLAEETGLTRLHVFRYSPRANTPAAEMCGQVDSATSARRASALRDLDADLRSTYVEMRLGGLADMLVERIVLDGDGVPYARGTTGDYLTVHTLAGGLSAGEIAGVRLISYSDGELLAERL